jgi:hypothetical protein
MPLHSDLQPIPIASLAAGYAAASSGGWQAAANAVGSNGTAASRQVVINNLGSNSSSNVATSSSSFAGQTAEQEDDNSQQQLRSSSHDGLARVQEHGISSSKAFRNTLDQLVHQRQQQQQQQRKHQPQKAAHCDSPASSDKPAAIPAAASVLKQATKQLSSSSGGGLPLASRSSPSGPATGELDQVDVSFTSSRALCGRHLGGGDGTQVLLPALLMGCSCPAYSFRLAVQIWHFDSSNLA